jgi:hypothetical protein
MDAPPNLSRFACAIVTNVRSEGECIELLNSITWNYEAASGYGRVLVSAISTSLTVAFGGLASTWGHGGAALGKSSSSQPNPTHYLTP